MGDRRFKVIDEFRKYLDNADFYNGGVIVMS